MIRWRETIFARSTAVRLAAAMAILFAASITIAFLVAYWLVAQDLEARTRAQIEDDARTFSVIYENGGVQALTAQLRAHALSGGEDTLYSYARNGAAAGSRAGVFEQAFTGWRNISSDDLRDIEEDELADRYLAFGMALGDGTLMVARSTDAADEVREIMSGAMLWGLGIALLLVIAGTALFARRTEARLGGLAEALDAVAAGQLDRRAPADATSDDLGRVAGLINAMLDRLSQNVASLKQVSADIAHDLKTPIQHLRTTLEGLKRENDLDPRANAVVDEAIEQTDRIVQTFQALLRIAQIEGGSPRARFRPTDLAELGQAIAEAFQPAVEEAGHRFRSQIDDTKTLLVQGDRDLLAQMLANLLTNAIRHTPAGSDIALSLRAENSSAVLTVSDTGPGIPVEERERVFRRLHRLERSRTTEGSGLGLSMVAAVVDLHGGEIRLDDNAPGLKAVVRLPLTPG